MTAVGGARRSLPEALLEAGIRLKSYDHREHRAACPECARSKARRDDIALAVLIDGKGATWHCHRCRWTGAAGTGQAPSYRPGQWQEPRPEPDRTAERRREQAQEIWRQTEPIADGLAFAYLTQRRGIQHWDCDRLRWHPACPWGADTDGCIVACVNHHATGHMVGIWRIKPAMDGPVERRGLGPVKHNAARLFWAEGSELVVTEGIEDALAAHALTGLPAWAALSAGNLADLILPERFREIAIYADADAVGTGHAAALARRLEREGRAVRLRRPRWAKDVNDALLARRAG